MSGNRVVYQNWIVEIGFDPANLRDLTETEKENAESIRQAVSNALEKLDEQEREFITLFYFIGKSYRRISDQSGRPIHKLEALHKRAVKKLRVALGGFVHERFGIVTDFENKCPICRSSFVAQINQLISERDKTATWKPVMRTLQERYGLKVSSPQVLIGHEKYHMKHSTSLQGKTKGGQGGGE